MAFKIKKDDTVVVITGKDKGKKGKVLGFTPQRERAIVEGVNVVKKHVRKRSEDQKGGVIQIESPIHISNLMLFCKQCSKQARVKVITLTNGARTRACSRCNEVF